MGAILFIIGFTVFVYIVGTAVSDYSSDKIAESIVHHATKKKKKTKE